MHPVTLALSLGIDQRRDQNPRAQRSGGDGNSRRQHSGRAVHAKCLLRRASDYVAKQHLASASTPQYLLVTNTGNANAGTGEQGIS